MNIKREQDRALVDSDLQQELQLLRLWADLLYARADELERAYAGASDLPDGVCALLPSSRPGQNLPLQRYPQVVLEGVLAAERQSINALATVEQALQAARQAARRRYASAWYARQWQAGSETSGKG